MHCWRCSRGRHPQLFYLHVKGQDSLQVSLSPLTHAWLTRPACRRRDFGIILYSSQTAPVGFTCLKRHRSKYSLFQRYRHSPSHPLAPSLSPFADRIQEPRRQCRLHFQRADAQCESDRSLGCLHFGFWDFVKHRHEHTSACVMLEAVVIHAQSTDPQLPWPATCISALLHRTCKRTTHLQMSNGRHNVGREVSIKKLLSLIPARSILRNQIRQAAAPV